MRADWGLLRDSAAARAVAAQIARESTRPLKIMEVCGSHSHCIARHGIASLLPPTVSLVPGPGCPVCVTPQSEVNLAGDIADLPGVTLATFGDLVRVPGSEMSLADRRAAGADVRIVHSALDALNLARAEPDRQIVFVAIGFETTAPTVAAALLAARDAVISNFSVLALHKTMPPAMRRLLEIGEAGINAFLCPGHVSAVIGSRAYEFLPDEFGAACAIAGFEPLDVLLAILALVRQWEAGQPRVEVEYSRIVRPDGNRRALDVLNQVFEACDTDWRGLGTLPDSGLRLRPRFAEFDAEARHCVQRRPAPPHPACRCGEVLRGVLLPPDCGAFGRACVPEHPLGPCMVSSEGACAAAWNYQR